MRFCRLLPFPSSNGWICIAEKIADNLPASIVIMNNIRRYMIAISYVNIIVTFVAFSFFDEITHFIANLSPSAQV